MKRLLLTALCALALPLYVANADDNNGKPNPGGKQDQTDGPKDHGGKCHGKDGNGKQKKNNNKRPAPDGAGNQQ